MWIHKKQRRFLLIGILLVSCPLLIWGVVKPARLLAPTLSGVTQVADGVYVDDLSRAEEATLLHAEAVAFVQENVCKFKHPPIVVLCATNKSSVEFGLKKQAGHCWYGLGIVIAPMGWQPYYVRHEMIHHLQIEQLGILKVKTLPQWFVEGMAYSMSDDPRPALSEPWQSYRTTFDKWLRNIERDKIWERAAEL
ncbi:MAG: hypothetical protein IPK72_24890 [Candidatus Eisenbacteria bacterium]|nr:hypothetical protein [Candidatus Eisenbacteria bacterium]